MQDHGNTQRDLDRLIKSGFLWLCEPRYRGSLNEVTAKMYPHLIPQREHEYGAGKTLYDLGSGKALVIDTLSADVFAEADDGYSVTEAVKRVANLWRENEETVWHSVEVDLPLALNWRVAALSHVDVTQPTHHAQESREDRYSVADGHYHVSDTRDGGNGSRETRRDWGGDSHDHRDDYDDSGRVDARDRDGDGKVSLKEKLADKVTSRA